MHMKYTASGMQSGHVVVQKLFSILSTAIAAPNLILGGDCKRAFPCQLLLRCSSNIVCLVLMKARSQTCEMNSQCLLNQVFQKALFLLKECLVSELQQQLRASRQLCKLPSCSESTLDLGALLHSTSCLHQHVSALCSIG